MLNNEDALARIYKTLSRRVTRYPVHFLETDITKRQTRPADESKIRPQKATSRLGVSVCRDDETA